MYTVDLNSDLGESFGAYKMGRDEEVIPLISSANVACGFHAGDPDTMNKTILLCKKNGTGVGAHPGFADMSGFGRRNMSMSPEEVRNMLTYQLGALDAFCKSHQVKLQHVKPHGALYNMAAKDKTLARAICEGIYRYDPNLTLLGLAGSEMIVCAKEMGLSFAQEVFADRNYEDDGSLVPRSRENAMIRDEEEAVSRVVEMIKTHTVKSVNAKVIPICPDSVCVHGDSEKALLFVKKIRSAFLQENILIRSFCAENTPV